MADLAVAVSETCFDGCRTFRPAGERGVELGAGLNLFAQFGSDPAQPFVDLPIVKTLRHRIGKHRPRLLPAPADAKYIGERSVRPAIIRIEHDGPVSIPLRPLHVVLRQSPL